jgi:hypothetical protein
LSSSDCQSIQGLTVQLSVNEALVPTPAPNGFSLQVNGYAPLGPGLPCAGIDWLQYILAVQNGQAYAQIQYWNNEICANLPPNTPCTWAGLGLTSQCGHISEPPFLPVDPVDESFVFWEPLTPNNVPSSGIIPSGSVLEVALTTSPAGLVTDALFTLTIPGAPVPAKASYSFLPDQQYGFPAVVPVVVGSPGNQATFSSGSGALSYSVSSGELCVQLSQGLPWSLCGITWYNLTGESSNAVYGGISPCCGSELSQVIWIVLPGVYRAPHR